MVKCSLILSCRLFRGAHSTWFLRGPQSDQALVSLSFWFDNTLSHWIFLPCCSFPPGSSLLFPGFTFQNKLFTCKPSASAFWKEPSLKTLLHCLDASLFMDSFLFHEYLDDFPFHCYKQCCEEHFCRYIFAYLMLISLGKKLLQVKFLSLLLMNQHTYFKGF